MLDETLLWRSRPLTPYVPTGKVLSVPSAALATTIAKLRRTGAVEASCLWLGSLDKDGNGQVAAVAVPKQFNRPRNYAVPGEAMVEVSALARSRGWTVVAAIHSHPGASVEHSVYDDEMTPSRRAVSIVFPYYGHWSGPWPSGLGVHEYMRKYWYLLSEREAQLRVRFFENLPIYVADFR
ncbi:MAG: Mov34/MPN/PAD-1 family protein [Anaerolineae bacterium]|nr:Mov34/MPN/PAD-1 family protein [Anaerolineae bacterium]